MTPALRSFLQKNITDQMFPVLTKQPNVLTALAELSDDEYWGKVMEPLLANNKNFRQPIENLRILIVEPQNSELVRYGRKYDQTLSELLKGKKPADFSQKLRDLLVEIAAFARQHIKAECEYYRLTGGISYDPQGSADLIKKLSAMMVEPPASTENQMNQVFPQEQDHCRMFRAANQPPTAAAQQNQPPAKVVPIVPGSIQEVQYLLSLDRERSSFDDYMRDFEQAESNSIFKKAMKDGHTVEALEMQPLLMKFASAAWSKLYSEISTDLDRNVPPAQLIKRLVNAQKSSLFASNELVQNDINRFLPALEVCQGTYTTSTASIFTQLP